MKKYELNYLISSELSDGEAKTLQNKIASFIKEQGSVLEEVGTPLQRKLAYSIRKQTQAYLAVLIFKSTPEKLADLEKALKEEKSILRHLILFKKPYKAVVERRRKPKPAVEDSEKSGEKMVVDEKEKRVELEEIEKKLEEILNE
jgi:small subunit ribosomal protein S6